MLGLIYVNTIGKNSDNEYVYEFYFSESAETAWGADWEVRPCVVCNLGIPQKLVYDEIKILKTNILLDLAQKNSCFSFLDCKDGIIPVAWENIDDADEYPEDGRLVFPFGADIYKIEELLNKRAICFDGYLPNNENF